MTTDDDALAADVIAMASGRVQGVGYRYALREAAMREGVAGWVRNLRDGRVEARLRGDAAAVGRVTEWMHRGPRGASVTAVDVTAFDITAAGVSPDGADDAAPTGFEIRRDG